MNATVVGADRLGNIPAVLQGFGIGVLRHVDGRASASQRRVTALPKGTQLLILFTDFLSHNAMHAFREAAREAGVPVLACRRSASSLNQRLRELTAAKCAAARPGSPESTATSPS